MALPLLLCALARPALTAPERSEPEKLVTNSSLDHGLLDPAWFGADVHWTRGRDVDFEWIRPDGRLDPPRVCLIPWEPPRLRKRKSPLDRALAGQLSEALQVQLRDRLLQFEGIELVLDPLATPYHAVGRVVEATHVREGAMTSLPLLSGFPTGTWDFKLVDVRAGTTLLATHHRMVGAGSFGWERFISTGLLRLLPAPDRAPATWEMPSGSDMVPDLGRRWVEPGLDLGANAIRILPWLADTESHSALFLSWSSGMGRALAGEMRPQLRRMLGARGFALSDSAEVPFTLQGRVFSTPARVHALYQARLRETGTGRIVARCEIRSPISSQPTRVVAERLAGLMSGLKRIHEPSQGIAGEGSFHPPWPETRLLVPERGPVDASWVHPRFRIQGHVLRVADWLPTPTNGGPADEAFAASTTRHAPGWLLGALTSYEDKGLQLSRTTGDLRLEGRVVEIDEADLRNFGTAMAAGFTFGLGTRSHQVIQLRIVDESDQSTLLLVQQRVVSYKMASSGTSYKAMKWIAQDFVPWLVRTGLR